MRFTIWIARGNGEHWRALEEVATGIGAALHKLGNEVEWRFGLVEPQISEGSRLVVFNSHVMPNLKLPPDAIIYNAEQVPTGPLSPSQMWWFSYYALLRKHEVWDYSETNIARLRRQGITNVRHCRVGWFPNSGIAVPPADPEHEDVSVLFVGSMNQRRAELIDHIRARGIDVKHIFGLYSYPRDWWIARAKIVLNVHFYPSPIFEIFRVSHLLASKKCVVSEGGGCDPELEAFASNATKLVAYDEIPETCLRLLQLDEKRRYWAQTGYELFKKIDQVAEVKRALTEGES